VFGGVSYRFWTNEYPNLTALKTILQYLDSRDNCLLAVRNDGTKDWLERVLTKRFDFFEFPDPGLFSLDKLSKNNKESGMIISVNNEDSDFRYNNKQIKNQLILSLKNACMSFWESYDEPIGLAPHSFEDYQMLLELIKTLPKRKLHQNIYVLPLLLGKKSEDFYRFYTSPRLVIASRVHSLSPSLGFGNVTVAINTQDRIARYLQDIEFTDVGINLYEIENDPLIVSKKSSYLYSDLDLWQLRVKNLRENQRNLAINFMDLICELL
jgi:polysaccharide pyruvyl transferase WcaK-like protein